MSHELSDPGHQPPPGVSDATITALGSLSEALEKVERARGALYEFHQLSGAADIALSGAVGELRDAGHSQIADRLEHDLVGRNVLHGRWTFPDRGGVRRRFTGRCSEDLEARARNETRRWDAATSSRRG